MVNILKGFISFPFVLYKSVSVNSFVYLTSASILNKAPSLIKLLSTLP